MAGNAKNGEYAADSAPAEDGFRPIDALESL
jgi:hypothetical protein